MRKQFLTLALLGLSVGLISWGFKGHQAVATIAQKHLTPHTAYVVSAYLQGESMANVSTWADEHRNPTGKWHFLNPPLGLSHQQFVDFVSQQSNDNVYGAILKEEAILKDNASSFEQRNLALKYLIHLIGDAHQPMHISRKEDKGGNTIQVRFDNKDTNLHSLWDSKLIDHEGLSEADMAKQYDWANEAQIKKWQADNPMEWLWESYQISTELYADVKPGQTMDEAYYKKYIPTIHLRIDQAGIRLAGELNKLLTDTKAKIVKQALMPQKNTPHSGEKVAAVNLNDIGKYIGDTVKVVDKIYGYKELANMTMLNMGGAFPNQRLTVILKGDAKKYLAAMIQLDSNKKSKSINGRQLLAIGPVTLYRSKPQIVISDPNKFGLYPDK
ncbi:S1/P1 nuclease [Mucilaginibacter sp. SP1R1]|uniref:S1/P1 nuclease n=1 Tax=Mucilaginibacter sp. SP1R1 TaxID=2723091 RepID=UPI001617FF99|nr:S1/P1 nuclease [Mucilaginibacter sp. SP1R1]MBB6152373.1 hypothetical protein [Mucilaginibacter sp. SP1R1]